jgi:hypothetical protein
MPSVFLHRHTYEVQRSNLSEGQGKAWTRLFLTMALPVLFLLIGISLVR